mgnify:CR=1 FL=1
MRYILFILIFFSFSSLANENFKPTLKCTNTSNSEDIVKFKKTIFKGFPQKKILIDDNGIIKELEYYRFYEPTSDIFILSYSDTQRGEGYRFNFTEWGDASITLGYDTPENDAVSVGLDYIYSHPCEEILD